MTTEMPHRVCASRRYRRWVGRSVGRSGVLIFHIVMCECAVAHTHWQRTYVYIHIKLYIHSLWRPVRCGATVNPPAEFRKVSAWRCRRVLSCHPPTRSTLRGLGSRRARETTRLEFARLFVRYHSRTGFAIARLLKGEVDGSSTHTTLHSHPTPQRSRGERVVSRWTWLHEDGVSVSPSSAERHVRYRTLRIHVGIWTSSDNRVAPFSQNWQVWSRVRWLRVAGCGKLAVPVPAATRKRCRTVTGISRRR